MLILLLLLITIAATDANTTTTTTAVAAAAATTHSFVNTSKALFWALATFSLSLYYTVPVDLLWQGISPTQASTYTQNNTNTE
jgi:hypothetical protein